MSVESDRLMCHDASLQSSVVFLGQQGGIKGAVRGAVTGQGMFTTQLAGEGQVLAPKVADQVAWGASFGIAERT